MAFSSVRSQGHADALAKLDALGAGTPLFEEGRDELRAILVQLQALGVAESRYALNLSIARGLDYYTGVVYETTLDAYPQIGSICSGGRYDNLASHYTQVEAARRRHLHRPDPTVLPAQGSRPGRYRREFGGRAGGIAGRRRPRPMRWVCRSACVRVA